MDRTFKCRFENNRGLFIVGSYDHHIKEFGSLHKDCCTSLATRVNSYLLGSAVFAGANVDLQLQCGSSSPHSSREK